VLYSPTFKSSSGKQSAKVRFWGYDDILLKLYLDIATNGGFERLVVSGRPTLEQCVTQWEEIVRRNSEENQSLQYQSYFSLVQAYTVLLAQHTTIKLLLMRSSLSGSKTEGFRETILELKKRGYVLDVSSNEKYAESIALCMNRSNAMVTKINMKQSEIKEQLKRSEANSKGGDGFTDLLANLEEALGGHRNLPEDITLAKYNSLKKIASKKIKAAQAAQRKGHGSGNR